MTEMSAPPIIAGIGDSHLEITTKSAKAQAYFDQGFNLLHCFWDFEAYRAFKEAARLDPNAAMAYWGIAEAVANYPAMEDIKKAALEKAEALMEKASDHEQYYIRAQKLQQDEDDGAKDFRAEMEALIDKYPDDFDAKLILAIHLDYGYAKKDGRPEDQAIYARMLVQDVLATHPNSAAAHHYRIHILEASTHPQDALAGRRCAGEARAWVWPHGPHARAYLLPAGRLRSGAAIVSRFHEGGFGLHAARKGGHAG